MYYNYIFYRKSLNKLVTATKYMAWSVVYTMYCQHAEIKTASIYNCFSLSARMLGSGELFVQIDFKLLSHKETPELLFVYVCS